MARTAPFHGVNRGSIPLRATSSEKMEPEILIFLIAFIAPVLYWRFLFWMARNRFNKPYLRTKTGLQIHHIHYGIILVLAGTLLILFLGKSLWVVGIMGLGLGLILDELVPSLLMPGNRELELEVYKKSLRGTLVLISIIVLAILILFGLTLILKL